VTKCIRLVVLVLAAGPAIVLAADPVTISFRRNQEGEKARRTKVETESKTVVVSDADGNKRQEQKNSKEHSCTSIEEFLEKTAGKKAAKLKVAFEAAGMKINDNAETLTLKGKTVMVERKEKNTTFNFADGEEVQGADAAFLKDEYGGGNDGDDGSLEKALLPKNPVAVGDTWQGDMQRLAEDFGKDKLTIDVKKSTATCKLLRIYKKGDMTYGVLDLKLNMIITDLGKADPNLRLAKDATMNIHLSMDRCIDGTTSSGKATATMELKAMMKVKQDGAELTVNVTNVRTMTETNEPVK